MSCQLATPKNQGVRVGYMNAKIIARKYISRSAQRTGNIKNCVFGIISHPYCRGRNADILRMGKKTGELVALLPIVNSNVVIHRNNLFISSREK